MQQPIGATQAGLELHREHFRDGNRTVDATAPARAAWVETMLLVVVYAVSILSLFGFATFGVHPELLAQAEVSPETYGRILVWAPRAQILIAVAALATFLVTHAGRRWVPAFVVIYAVSLGAELAGTTLGLPFGPYHYTDGLGIKWFGHVPVLIPASWFMMALPSYAIAAWRFRGTSQRLGCIALGSFILLSWDFALDPAMSAATKYWVWGTAGPYYGMPVLNLVGWFVTGFVLMIAFAALRADGWVDRLPTSWLLGFYGANLLLPVGMSVAAGLWGVVVATGVALALAAVIGRRSLARSVA